MLSFSVLITIISILVSLGAAAFAYKRYQDKPDDVTNELRPELQETSYSSPALHPHVGSRRGGNHSEISFTVKDIHVTFQEKLPPDNFKQLKKAFTLQTRLTLELGLPALPWVEEIGHYKEAYEIGEITENVLLQILADKVESDIIQSLEFQPAPEPGSNPELILTISTYNTSEIDAVLKALESSLCYSLNSWWLFGQTVEDRVESYHEYKRQQNQLSSQ